MTAVSPGPAVPLDHPRRLTRFNRRANGRLYGAAERVGEEAFRRDLGAFVKSMCGTLNHLLADDMPWHARATGRQETRHPLDVILYPGFAEPAAARRREDDAVCAAFEAMTPAEAERPLVWRDAAGPERPLPLRLAWQQVANLQTHHRARVHTLLSVTGAAPPQLDLLLYLCEEESF